MHRLVRTLQKRMNDAIVAPLALVGLLTLGCGPSWTVVRQDASSSLFGVQSIAVDPVQIENLRIGEKSEAEWLAKKKPEQQLSWEADKAALDQRLFQGIAESLKAKNIRLLREGNYPGVPHVRAVISRIEPGFYGGIVNAPAEVDVTLQVIQGNAVSREITYQSKGLDFSLGGRVRVAAKQAGFIAAKYLETQVALR